MTTNYYKALYRARIDAVLATCRTVDDLTHQGEKGRIREILIRSLFRPLLPGDIGVGTGFVISASGAVSEQQDVVVYDRATLSPALFDEAMGFFPVESVITTIEIKTRLTRAGLVAAEASAASIASYPLVQTNGTHGSHGPRPDHTVFALSSDLTRDGQSELDRYMSVVGTSQPQLGAICVAGVDYFWRKSDDGWDGWQRWPCRSDEVIGFLGGILNAVPDQCMIRRSYGFSVGNYLIDFGADLTAVDARVNALAIHIESVADPTADWMANAVREIEDVGAQIEVVFANYRTGRGHESIDEVKCDLLKMLAILRERLAAV